MVRVLASGTFDILHLGHLYYLEHAKRLGNELIVAVSSDSAARSDGREPIMPEQLRLEIVRALKPVDQVVLNAENDLVGIIDAVQPDIVALGYDQTYDLVRLKTTLIKRNLQATIMRLQKHPNSLLGSGQIINTIVDWAALVKV